MTIDKNQMQRIADFIASELGVDANIAILITTDGSDGQERFKCLTTYDHDDACTDMIDYVESTIEDDEEGDDQMALEFSDDTLTRTLQ